MLLLTQVLVLLLQRALRWDLSIHTLQQNAFICLLPAFQQQRSLRS